MIDAISSERFGDSGGNLMLTRSEILAEREALKRGDRKFVFVVISFMLVTALIFFSTVGRAAGTALARLLH